MSRKTLTILTVAEVGAVVGALAVYLGLIASTLRAISSTLGEVSMGVRAIERQTEPVGPTLAEVRENIEAANGALQGSEVPTPGEQQ
jgi:hypothetical protein